MRVSERSFAEAMIDAGLAERMKMVGGSSAGELRLTGRGSGWYLTDLTDSDWLLARTPCVRAIMSATNWRFDACAGIDDQVFALLDDGTAVDLQCPSEVARLGARLHDASLLPGAYAQTLARTQSPGTWQNWDAQVVATLDDVGDEFRGRGISAVEPARAWRTPDHIALSFWARCRGRPHGFGRAVPRLDRWWVDAPRNGPVSWRTQTGYEDVPGD